MIKLFQKVIFALTAALLLNSCVIRDDSVKRIDPTRSYTNAFIVLGRGESPLANNNTIDIYEKSSDSLQTDAYYLRNGQKLGTNLQCAIADLDNIYLAMKASGSIVILDKNTLAQKASFPIPQPNSLCLDGKYLYVSSDKGCVYRIELKTYVTNQISVGRNPHGMTVANGFLYVANTNTENVSDENAENYVVSKINLSSFTVTKNIKVDNTPTNLLADKYGNIFVTCSGNETETKSEIFKIDLTDNAAHFADADLMAVRDAQIYLAKKIEGNVMKDSVAYFSLGTLRADTINNKLFANKQEIPLCPIDLQVSPYDGFVYVTTDSVDVVNSSNSRGYVYQYRLDGTLVNKFSTSLHPFGVVLFYERKFY